ncbi:MAG TPA: tetratricopeptide repeat protein [Polyangiales bacterium]|nr:tetratricopeptide repeat protein [Polyangiales bacterium]
MTQIGLRRNVRPMPRSAIGPLLWALAVAWTVAGGSAYAQAPATPPAAQPPASPSATPAAPAPAAPASSAPAGPATEPTPEAKDAARAAYGRGQTAFAAGRYDEARVAFEEAFAAVPNPIVLLSVSESRAKLGQTREAITALERYLQLKPDAADRADVEAKIKALGSMPAYVTVTSKPPGAQLTIDDAATPQIAPAQLELAPGKHVLKYALPGYVSNSEVVEVDPGARYELEVVLQAAPAATPVPPPVVTAPPAPVPSGPPTAAIWITAGLGAAGIITGSVLGLLALKAESDFDAMPTEELADKGERLALFADVGFGIGIMALATTAVLLFTHDSAAPTDEQPAETTRLELIPQVTPHTASATARVRF